MSRPRNSDSNSSVGSCNGSIDGLQSIDRENLALIPDQLLPFLSHRKEDNKFNNEFMKQGAIPKSYNTGSCRPQNPYKWYRSNKSDFGGDRSRSGSMPSLDSESEEPVKNLFPRNTFPFYYVVPENPRQVNILRPGTYLVIPQNIILKKALNVINHPKRSDGKTEQGEADENPRKGGGKNKSFDENVKVKSGGRGEKTRSSSEPWRKEKPNKKLKDEKAKTCDEALKESIKEEEDSGSKLTEELWNETEVSEEAQILTKSEFSGSELSDSELAYLMTELPYFDENYLKREWVKKKPGLTSDLFVKDLKERRINEVYIKVCTDLPKISAGGLLQKISEIMVSDEAVEDFIEMEKLKAREEVLETLKTKFEDFSEEEITYSYERFLGSHATDEESDPFDFVRNDLIVSREEEKKMQQLQMISTMVPDVDADYVLSRLSRIGGDMDELNYFIVELLENPNYPKTAEFDPKTREKQKLWNYYVVNYSVTNYLQKVPDPEQFFSGSSVRDRKIQRSIAIKFLTKRYPDLDEFQLNDAFTNSDENIVKTCEVLDRNYLPEISIDEEMKSNAFSEAFLQEITFIVHKDEILKHLSDEKERRRIEIQLAEEENSFFECLLCYDENVIPSEAVVCPEGHITCKNCLINYIEMSFAEGKYLFPCLNGSCDTEYAMKILEKLLKPELFTRITQRRAAEDVDKAAVPGLEKCPSCDFAYVPAPEDKIFTCLNDACLSVTCRLCKEPNHIPLSCKEVERPQDIQARQKVEEAMTEKLVRSCPKCFKRFIKNDGCNKIACSCGALICYICSAIVQDYSHFNGMGGSQFHKCPLFSENRKLHVADVLEAGIKEKERIKKENPNINFVFDPTDSNLSE